MTDFDDPAPMTPGQALSTLAQQLRDRAREKYQQAEMVRQEGQVLDGAADMAELAASLRAEVEADWAWEPGVTPPAEDSDSGSDGRPFDPRPRHIVCPHCRHAVADHCALGCEHADCTCLAVSTGSAG